MNNHGIFNCESSRTQLKLTPPFSSGFLSSYTPLLSTFLQFNSSKFALFQSFSKDYMLILPELLPHAYRNTHLFQNNGVNTTSRLGLPQLCVKAFVSKRTSSPWNMAATAAAATGMHIHEVDLE